MAKSPSLLSTTSGNASDEKDLINLEDKINNLDNNYPVQLSFRFGSKIRWLKMNRQAITIL